MVSRHAWKNRFCIALLLGAVATQAVAADAVLSIVPSASPAVVGSTVNLNIQLNGVVDLYAYNFSLSFDPSVLQATGGTEGALLATGGSTYFDVGTIDNTTGLISYSFNTLVGAVPGVNGSGSLAQLSFNVLTAGSTALTFSDTIFLNSSLGDVSLQIQNGALQTVAVPEPATYALFALGLAGLVALRRRQTT